MQCTLKALKFTVGKVLEGRHSHHIHHMEVVLQNTQEPEEEQGSSHLGAVRVGRQLMCLELGKMLAVELSKQLVDELGKEQVVELGKEQVVELGKELVVVLHMKEEEAE